MRISDWSSDVCSSDLAKAGTCPARVVQHVRGGNAWSRAQLIRWRAETKSRRVRRHAKATSSLEAPDSFYQHKSDRAALEPEYQIDWRACVFLVQLSSYRRGERGDGVIAMLRAKTGGRGIARPGRALLID